MKTFNQEKIRGVIRAMGLSLVLAGCNTVEGVGTDISRAGHALEHAAGSEKKSCAPTEPCPIPQVQARPQTQAR